MKRSMPRLIALLCAVTLTLCACAPLVNNDDLPKEFSVYASFYPIYALSALIIDADIPGITLNQLVQPQDGCLRSYQISDWDLALALRADALILGGRGLESFADGFLALDGDGPAVVTAMNALTLASYDSSGDDAFLFSQSDESEDAVHFIGDNPWLFLSVAGAKDICEAVAANMILLDEPYAEKYRENLADAINRLVSLDGEMRACLSNANLDTPTAIMHEGVEYFAADMELNVVCRIARESGETPDAQTLALMLEALNKSGASVVLIESQAPMSLTRALENAGFRVCMINTLSTGGQEMGADGYFSAMMGNATRLASTLNKE